jgi:hypothetical protein
VPAVSHIAPPCASPSPTIGPRPQFPHCGPCATRVHAVGTLTPISESTLRSQYSTCIAPCPACAPPRRVLRLHRVGPWNPQEVARTMRPEASRGTLPSWAQYCSLLLKWLQPVQYVDTTQRTSKHYTVVSRLNSRSEPVCCRPCSLGRRLLRQELPTRSRATLDHYTASHSGSQLSVEGSSDHHGLG